MLLRKAGLLSLVCGTLLAIAGESQAQIVSPFVFGGTLGWPNNFYQSSRVVPYYALHPPVYYSRPVARTYGYSPFAYPPGVMTPDIVECDPVMIENPHVEPSSQSNGNKVRRQTVPAERSASAPQPRVIENPFVEPWQIAAE